MIAPARRAAFAVLLDVAHRRRVLADALADARVPLTDVRDRALAHDLATGTLRWRSRLDYALEPLLRTPLTRLDIEVLTALRLGAYQVLHLSRVPPSAVVHDAVELVRQARRSSATGLVNAVLRRLAGGEHRALPPRPDDQAPADAWVGYLALVHAHPAWLVERWLERDRLAATEARLIFDNTVASSGDTSGGGPMVRDEGSQIIGTLAAVRPGDRVLDLCAAPGGKALQYAQAAGDAGLVVACDVRPRRVALLAETLQRGAVGHTAVVHIAPDGALPFRAEFDVVTVDAPCTGLGTLRRDPDVKWRHQPTDVTAFAERQRAILDRASVVVRPGGVLVYSTCSTEPEENEAVVDAFLTQAPAFRRDAPPPALDRFTRADASVRLLPERDALEGYYGVRLRHM